MSVFKNIKHSEIFRLKDLISEGRGQTISYGMLDNSDLTVYMYFFDEGEGISEMKSPFQNLIKVLEGKLRIEGRSAVELDEGDVYIVPENTDVVITAAKSVKYISILLPMEGQLIKNIDLSTKLIAKELIDYRPGQVANLTLVNKPGLNLSVIAIDEGEGLKTHTAPGDAMVIALDGEARITIADEEFILSEGETLVMPKDIPHAVFGATPFKMLLILVKDAEAMKPITPN